VSSKAARAPVGNLAHLSLTWLCDPRAVGWEEGVAFWETPLCLTWHCEPPVRQVGRGVLYSSVWLNSTP
jgi:hypothetical protein